jgi:uncharacterized Fe-S cluster protein YjdI
MTDIEKKYTNGEVTVFWKPEQCIHSANCWKGLVSVFNPRVKPWVNISGTSSDEITAQIDKCPSGALKWKRNAELQNETQKEINNMDHAVEIVATENGPLKVAGMCVVKDAAGNVIKEGENVYLCRCGQSAKKPFCDGSHKKIDFVG